MCMYDNVWDINITYNNYILVTITLTSYCFLPCNISNCSHHNGFALGYSSGICMSYATAVIISAITQLWIILAPSLVW